MSAALLAWPGLRNSPSLNEPAHAAAGVRVWHFAQFDVYCVNPPLVRAIAALPLMCAGAATDWHSYNASPAARSEVQLGEDFIAANGQRSAWLFTLARWACIPFSLIGGYVCFRWGCELYGQAAGLMALTLWCFCPNILGHGALVTCDVPAAALGLAAAYTFWRWLKQPTWPRALMSGLVLGIAELAKMTLVIFIAIWPLVWLVYRWSERRAGSWKQQGRADTPSPCPDESGLPSPVRLSSPKSMSGEGQTLHESSPWFWREAGMIVARTLVAVYILNLGYAFEGSGTLLKDFRFVSETLCGPEAAEKPGGGNRFADSWLGYLPVPLPKNYLLGMDLQKRDFEHYTQPSYLRNEFSPRGWWYWYLYALAIKVPLGTWLLVGMAASRGLWLKSSREEVEMQAASERPPTEESVSVQAASQRPPTGEQAASQKPPTGEPASMQAASQRPPTETPPATATLRDEFVLLCPAVVILAFVSSQTGFSQHMRYVLPAFPFVFVWIGRLARAFDGKHRLMTGIISAALLWSIGSSLWVYPHSLSYFNELAGGPTGGPAHLIHSNIDWGQDLLYLKHWLDEHAEAQPVRLAYFGGFDPRHLGVEYTAPDKVPPADSTERPAPGWYAISVNFVRGFPHPIFTGDGSRRFLRQNELAWFQRLKPTAMAGYSIYIYHVAE